MARRRPLQPAPRLVSSETLVIRAHATRYGLLTTSVTDAVFSGARAFELLTPEEQEFALNTTVTYAPQAYEYIRQCKASEDGLTIPSMGKEVPTDQLSEWSWDKVAEHPVGFIFVQLFSRSTST